MEINAQLKRGIFNFIGFTSPYWVCFVMSGLCFKTLEYNDTVSDRSWHDFLAGLVTIFSLLWFVLAIASFIITIVITYRSINRMITPVILVIIFYLLPAFIAHMAMMSGVGMKQLKEKQAIAETKYR